MTSLSYPPKGVGTSRRKAGCMFARWSRLTCRRSSRGRSFCPHSGRPPPRSAADRAAYAHQAAWTHPAACSRSGSIVPYPRCPPSRRIAAITSLEDRCTISFVRALYLSLTTDARLRCARRFTAELLLLPADALPPPAHARPLKGWPTEASPSVAESKHALKQDGRFPSARRTTRSLARALADGWLALFRSSLHRVFIPRR